MSGIMNMFVAGAVAVAPTAPTSVSYLVVAAGCIGGVRVGVIAIAVPALSVVFVEGDGNAIG